MKVNLLRQLQLERGQKRPAVLATRVEDGEQVLITPGLKDQKLSQVAEAALRSDKASVEIVEGEAWFINPFNPPLRLIVVGAVHIAQPLVQMAALANYQVFIIDPREAFGSEDRFPSLTVSHQWPDEALRDLKPDSRTAIVTLSHDPKIDDPALECALNSDCFYVGALGSQKTHWARLERLKRKGFDETTFERIHGPVGLSIGAKSPSEIATSILAQMTQVLRQGNSS